MSMPYVLVRHKVRDFGVWKPFFDADAPMRRQAGLRDKLVLRNADDPQELVILFETDDLGAARGFSQAPQLKEIMEKAGVLDKPDIYFLEGAG
jgi:hypothetical protein